MEEKKGIVIKAAKKNEKKPKTMEEYIKKINKDIEDMEKHY